MLIKKDIGYAGEEIAKTYYENKGYETLVQNYTIRGGEIDLILQNEKTLVFVEVKVVNSLQDISGYITQKKLNFLYKTIQYYISQNKIEKDYRLDAVFIKNGKIYEVYENLSL